MDKLDQWGVRMDRDKAAQVRRWRVDDGLTWRGVADAASRAWELAPTSNQIFGKYLCEAAGALLGEDLDQ